MVRRSLMGLVIMVGLGFLSGGCRSNDYSPASSPPPPNTPSLTAVPSFANVAIGMSENLSISGGTPPYAIAAGPAGIATAQLLNSDSLVATLRITGVSIASGGTSVTVRDNSTSSLKTVTVPIAVR